MLIKMKNFEGVQNPVLNMLRMQNWSQQKGNIINY